MIKPAEKKNDYDEENEDDNEDRALDNIAEDYLDMAPPWSPKLFIDKEKMALGCVNGEKTVFYIKCKVQYFAENQ